MTGQQRYIALLRGVNVGRAKRIAMADLRQLVAALGYTDVSTVLASGNVVFSGPPAVPAEVAAAIEETLVLKLGVAARVIVLTAEALADIVAANVLLAQASDPSRLLAFVYADPAVHAAALAPLRGQTFASGALALGARAAYVWCPDGVLSSDAAEAVNKLLGDQTTARNWNTLCRLHALCTREAT